MNWALDSYHPAINVTGPSLFTVDIDTFYIQVATYNQEGVLGEFSPLHAFGATQYVQATEDAFVRNGTYAATNYGSNTSLTVKNSTSGYTRYSYIKFDLSALSEPVARATLQLWKRTQGVDMPQLRVHRVSSNWNESTITFNNKPALGEEMGLYSPYAVTPALEISDYVNEAVLDGDQYLSVAIVSTSDTGSEGWVNYGSTERTTVSERPMLKLTAVPAVESSADTYVNDGSKANDNFGNRDYMNLKTITASNSGYVRHALVRFDLREHTRPVSRAVLRLVPSNLGETMGDMLVRGLPDGVDWDEDTVTWNNKPSKANASYAGSRTPTAIGRPVDITITAAVNTAIAESRPLSLYLENSRDYGEKGFVSYRTREYSDARYRPQVLLWE
jgi:hypothetical protein